MCVYVVVRVVWLWGCGSVCLRMSVYAFLHAECVCVVCVCVGGVCVCGCRCVACVCGVCLCAACLCSAFLRDECCVCVSCVVQLQF